MNEWKLPATLVYVNEYFTSTSSSNHLLTPGGETPDLENVKTTILSLKKIRFMMAKM
ncbi:hypothetical protein [Mariniphaga anaerophila]|uniref:hypothetical protein n=1 Tax=Mariniphaga anaerophila TaxID=1484053 RepID=UPI001C3148BC|nr:hypothetical protein [Mariniphaga anaerophila]